MKFPCEIIVWKVLPAIRAQLAMELAKQGLSQKEIAKKLDITEAAVSQYINKKRAQEFKIDDSFVKEFAEAAKKLSEGSNPQKVMEQSCKLCRDMRRGGHICKMHHKHDTIPAGCNICFAGGAADEC
jgi:predicted transcriptional regulator